MTSMKSGLAQALALSLLGAALAPSAALADPTVVPVTEFAPVPADPADLVPGTWYDWFTTNAGTSSVVSLSGMGGALEIAQPLPTGAARLTTEVNADRANPGVYDLLGTPADIFPTLGISYWFLKGSNAGQNLNAAAALKLEIVNPTCDDPASAGDCFGTLIYEPYVNGFGNHPLQDVWQQAVITPDSGGFWWSGGFGVGSSGGGPPYRTLNQWLALLDADFQDATIASVQIGVGSYNAGQRAYFDAVEISHAHGDGLDVLYDFEPSLPVAIDVRPGSHLNQVNTNAKQLVPIAILGSEGFDPVSEVDPSSVRVRGVATPVPAKDDVDDVNGDGIPDLTLYFRARAIPKPTEEECNDPDAQLALSGVTFTAKPFAGTDDVDWQGPDCNF